jgi:hypothetical protein
MIEKEQKYHIKINCSGKLIEVIYAPGKDDYRLGDRVLIHGHIIIDEILKCRSMGDHQSFY